MDWMQMLMQQAGGSSGGAGAAGAIGGIAAATPYGAAANAAGQAADAVLGGGASSTSGDIGDVSNNFGGVNIGTDALYSPVARAVATYQPRRYGAPAPTANADGITYSSTVSASGNGVAIVAGVAALAGLALLLTKKGK